MFSIYVLFICHLFISCFFHDFFYVCSTLVFHLFSICSSIILRLFFICFQFVLRLFSTFLMFVFHLSSFILRSFFISSSFVLHLFFIYSPFIFHLFFISFPFISPLVRHSFMKPNMVRARSRLNIVLSRDRFSARNFLEANGMDVKARRKVFRERLCTSDLVPR